MRSTARPAAQTTGSAAAARPWRLTAPGLVVLWLMLAATMAPAAIVTGTYTGDGTMPRAITGLGFQPVMVIVKGDNAAPAVLRNRLMVFNDAKALAGTQPLVTDGIIGLNIDGFTVADGPTANADGVEYAWTAFSDDPGQLSIGFYFGSGGPGAVTNVGFRPAALIILPMNNQPPHWTATAVPAGEVCAFDAESARTGLITGLTATGFDYGSDPAVSALANIYHYVAWSADAAKIVSGSYLGTGTSGQELADLPLAPEWALVKARDALAGLQKPRALGGNRSAPFSADGATTSGIKQLTGDGFRVGGDPRANEAGRTFYYLALAEGEARSSDLGLAVTATPPVVAAGDTVDVRVTLANAGPDDGEGIEVAVTPPAGLSVVGGAAAVGDWDQEAGRWSVPALGRGAGALLRLRLLVGPGQAGRTLPTAAGIAGLVGTDPVPADNVASAAVAVEAADLELRLRTSNATPAPGQQMQIDVELENHGPQATGGIAVILDWPTGLSYNGAAEDVGNYVPGSATWSVPGLAAGATAHLWLTCRAEMAAAGSGLTLAGRIIASDVEDPAPANDTASVTMNVTDQASDLGLAWSADDPRPDTGQTVGLTLTLSNHGPGASPAATVRTTLPAGLLLVGHAAGAGAYDPGTGQWSLSTLAAGEDATLDLQMLVEAAVPGTTLTATAVIRSADQPDPVDTNDNARVDIVVAGADLSLQVLASDPAPLTGAPVSFAFTLRNGGPDALTAADIDLGLGAALTYVGAAPGTGSYDADARRWHVPGLAAGATATLTIQTTADGLLPGQDTTVEAEVAAATPADPVTANNSDAVTIGSLSADLEVALAVDDAHPDEGQTVTLTSTVANLGPDAATAVEVALALPVGLTFVAGAPTPGTFDGATGAWVVGDLAAGATATLIVTATVGEATAGRSLAVVATVVASGTGDPVPANDEAAAALTVTSADLALNLAADDSGPTPGGTVSLTLTLENLGPDRATGVTVATSLPAGLALAAAVPATGIYDAQSGLWSVPGLDAGASTHLQLVATVDPGAGGSALTVAAAVADAVQGDPVGANDHAEVQLNVGYVPVVRVVPRTFADPRRRLLPGGPSADVLRFDLVNNSAAALPLRALTVANPVVGDGTQAQQDGAWSGLGLEWRRAGDRWTVYGADGSPAAAVFAGGLATFGDLDLTVAAGDTLHLILSGAASLGTGDGLELRPTLAGPSALVFGVPVDISGSWPVQAGGQLAVDGMTAAQIALHEVGPLVFQLGSTRNPALDVTLPDNGGQPDQLTRLNVRNHGSAGPDVLTRVEAWADDGDGAFNAAADQRLGELHWTGDRWEATGLSRTVPSGGLRIVVTVDVAPAALGGTIRLGLPAGDDTGVGMASGNDGPIDAEVVNPFAQAVSATDRVIVTAVQTASQTLAPAQTNVPLLQVLARNLYATERSLDRLQVHNRCAVRADAPAGQGDLLLSQLQVRADGDGDGALGGLEQDPVLGSAVFIDGVATFEGLHWSLPPDATQSLFVTGSLTLWKAADGDTVAALVGGPADLRFDQTVALVGDWPLDSGARHRVDGMTAAQLGNREVPAISLTPGDGPVLALDLTVPGDGYAADNLSQLRLVNRGSARVGDIAGLRLWADDGDGAFTPASDLSLGAMAGVDSVWVAPGLDVTVPSGGLRLFTSLEVSAAPSDSVTVRLAVPVGGVTVDSANDGPRDVPSASPTTLLISTAPLLTDLRIEPARSTVGQTVQVTMTVTNVSGEDVAGIVPSTIAITGDGGLAIGGGPEPAQLDLASGASGTVTWTGTAQAPGKVRVAASAAGLGVVGGQVRRSLESTSGSHDVLTPATGLGLYPVANMPVSVNRGQTNIVPLNLTLVNDGGETTSEISLSGLVLTLDDGDGQALVPASLLSRVSVNEGFNVYASRTDLETSGQAIRLSFSPPAIITTREPVTIGLRLDVRPDAAAASFRLLLAQATDFVATDHVSGAAVPIEVLSGSLPFSTGTCRLVAQATGLVVAAPAQAARHAGVGQDAVELLRLELTGTGDPSLPSNVQVASFRASLTDTFGRKLAVPQDWLDQIRVTGPLAVHAQAAIVDAGDTTLAFSLLPTVVVPVGEQPVTLGLYGRIPATARPGTFRLQLEPAPGFDARDGNVGTPVAVTYQPQAIQGPPVTIQAPVGSLTLSGQGLLASGVALGARELPALRLQLGHDGDSRQASAELDTLHLMCLDPARRPLDPASVCDRLRVLWNGVTCADLAPPPATDGRIAVPLSGAVLAAGTAGQLLVVVDLEAQAPAAGFELTVSTADVIARDTNLATRVAVVAGTGGAASVSSGLAYFRITSDEVQVALQDRMPALLAGDGRPVTLAELSLRNPAPSAASGLELRSLTLRARDAAGSALRLGDACGALAVMVADTVWASVGEVAPGDSVVTLTGTVPLPIPAAGTVRLTLQAVFRGEATGSLLVGVTGTDMDVNQADGAAGTVRVRPVDGTTFPLWTESGHFGELDLEGSFLNFPNPFAAGRESTRLAFQLERAAAVSLRILDSRGVDVAVICDRLELAAGLHQEFAWDGRNGRGDPVRNGVYLAELVVSGPDGSRTRLLRKVAVVR